MKQKFREKYLSVRRNVVYRQNITKLIYYRFCAALYNFTIFLVLYFEGLLINNKKYFIFQVKVPVHIFCLDGINEVDLSLMSMASNFIFFSVIIPVRCPNSFSFITFASLVTSSFHFFPTLILLITFTFFTGIAGVYMYLYYVYLQYTLFAWSGHITNDEQRK